MKVAGRDATHGWTFHEKPWRHYQCDGSRETPNGLKIASVTQILGTLSKDALVAWAANLTCQGVWTLWGEKGYRRPRDLTKKRKDGSPYTVPGWRRLQGDLKSHHLDHNSIRDEAAFRGTSIHALHEDWVRDGKMPVPSEFPEEWQGYIRAYAGWLLTMVKQGATFESSETILGSATHGFAGTCDTVVKVVGRDGKRIRADFKTSKQVYARTNFRQLAAYEGADVEMGNEPTDEQIVVALHENGTFESAVSTEGFDSFLRVLAVWRDDQPLNKIDDAAYKARIKGAKA